MKKILSGTILLISVIFCESASVKAQSVQALAGDVINGALTGTALGAATMAVSNSDDFYNLQVGVGLGTLYGIGMAGFDVAYGKGSDILVSGIFHDANNTAVIILMDTFYGAAVGAVLATSIQVVADEPLVDGLQYGAGYGAYIGFGFGVVDAFLLAKRSREPRASLYTPDNNASGLVGIDFENGNSVGFLSPSLVQTLEISSGSLTQSLNPSVELINYQLNF